MYLYLRSKRDRRRLVHIVEMSGDPAGMRDSSPCAAAPSSQPGTWRRLPYLTDLWCPSCFQRAHRPVRLGPLA